MSGIATRPRSGEAGFNLIEVIVALALLAVVMLSISGLFAQGSNSIKSGKELTEALAQATDILEDVHQLSYKQLYAVFGAGGGDATFSADTSTNTYAGRWQGQIEEALWQGHAVIDLAAIGVDTLLAGCVSTSFACGQAVRVTVTMHWEERGQPQQLSLATMRF